MKKLILACLLAAIAAITLLAQGSVRILYGHIGNKATWFTLGPTLTVSVGGQLDVAPRVYNHIAVYDAAAQAWILPTPASNVFVTVEGCRYVPGKDYAIAPGRMTALSTNMLPQHLVVIDYDPR